MVRKKIDNRIRTLIENCVLSGHRSMFVIVGEKSRDNVSFIFPFSFAFFFKLTRQVYCYIYFIVWRLQHFFFFGKIAQFMFQVVIFFPKIAM